MPLNYTRCSAPDIEESKSDPPSPPKQSPSDAYRTIGGIVVDSIVCLGIIVLIGLGKLTPSEGLPIIVAVTSLHLTLSKNQSPSMGGAVALAFALYHFGRKTSA